MAQVRELLEQQLRRTPTTQEIAEEMNTTRRRVEQLHAMQQRPTSLDRPIGGEGRATVGDQLADPAGALADEDPATPWAQVDDPAALLERLDARERAVITDLFGLRDGTARTIEEVAPARRVPPALVSRTVHNALRKLRTVAGLDEAA